MRNAASIQTGGLAEEIGKRRPFESREQETFLNLLRTADCLLAEFAALYREFGIIDAQYNALRILRGHATRVPVHRVAEQMVTRQPDITRLIDRLEKAGLAVRDRCRDDRRVVWVSLTPAGRSLLAKLDGPVMELHRKQLGHLGARNLKTLSHLLYTARHRPGSNG